MSETTTMLRSLLRLFRPGDWVKNVFILPALVFGDRRDEPEAIALSALAFVAFCLLCSGTYAINDVIDAEKDRQHPVKRQRPVASGAIRPRVALATGVALIAGAMSLGFAIRTAFGGTLIMYLLLQVAYNMGLKRVIFVDVVTIALGFAVRSAAGAFAIDVRISPWLLMCVFFLCLYLGFIKRLCDLASAEAEPGTAWHSPAGYDNRGELDWLLGLSAVLAVVTYLMYAMSDHVGRLFGPQSLGFTFLSPLVLIAVHRFYRRASTGRSDSPFAALRDDPVVLFVVLLFCAGVVAILYLPGVDELFENLLTPRESNDVG